ncbi:MAG: hypothetical protein HC925_08905 [Coleofasciculaceae cyanobacterium SM2_3_26]|nr:hypothetical protein [Coleofasciculaceae cyanobacterium SM2_3_26]
MTSGVHCHVTRHVIRCDRGKQSTSSVQSKEMLQPAGNLRFSSKTPEALLSHSLVEI